MLPASSVQIVFGVREDDGRVLGFSVWHFSLITSNILPGGASRSSDIVDALDCQENERPVKEAY